MHADAKKRVAF